MEPVLLDKDGPIGWLTLNRPEKRNALSLELMTDMLNKLEIIAQDQDIRVIVIRGNGPVFCAGHNLKEMTGTDYDIQHFHKIFSVSAPACHCSGSRCSNGSWMPACCRLRPCYCGNRDTVRYSGCKNRSFLFHSRGSPGPSCRETKSYGYAYDWSFCFG